MSVMRAANGARRSSGGAWIFLVAAVQAAGYLGATTTNPGLGKPTEAFTLKRIRINYSDGVGGFVAKMQRYAG